MTTNPSIDEIVYEKEQYDTKERVAVIRQTIRNEEEKLRAKYPILNKQDTLGLACFVISVLSIICVAYLYLKRSIEWWLAVPLIALPGSLLHELEHDLIHNLYFKSKKWVQHVMFAFIYVAKMSILPWLRKVYHLKHHSVSGQASDIEERLIGMGLKFDVFRFFLSWHPAFTQFVFWPIKKDAPDFNPLVLWLATVPVALPFTIFLHLFVEYSRLFLGLTFGPNDYVFMLPLSWWPFVRDFCVIMVFPNVLRQACLAYVASYSHYYEDIPKRNVFFQCQILDHPLLWPLQLFCFNFGATHIIHHFVIEQPFYLRQMIADAAHKSIIAQGGRRNDFGIVKRANRMGPLTKKEKELLEDRVAVPAKPSTAA